MGVQVPPRTLFEYMIVQVDLGDHFSFVRLVGQGEAEAVRLAVVPAPLHLPLPPAVGPFALSYGTGSSPERSRPPGPRGSATNSLPSARASPGQWSGSWPSPGFGEGAWLV